MKKPKKNKTFAKLGKVTKARELDNVIGLT